MFTPPMVTLLGVFSSMPGIRAQPTCLASSGFASCSAG